MRSWVDSANAPDTDFPIQNLPYGVVRRADGRCVQAVALGEFAVDVGVLADAGLVLETTLQGVSWNAFMAQGPNVWADFRARLTDLLKEGGDPTLKDNGQLRDAAFLPRDAGTLCKPFEVAEYTDFFAGRQHATNAGIMLRGPDKALPANWLHMPTAYNARASTVVVSETEIRRPCGQLKGRGFDAPIFAASRRLDIELELGAVVGMPSAMGKRLSVAEADDAIFGYVLINDWSARDMQAWEAVPLGPFLSKAFATTISPWIVPKAALEPFRTASPTRDVPLLPYLEEPEPMLYDIALEVGMTPSGETVETVISRTNAKELYYSSAQQLAHHTSGGCAMRTGDLLGSGTISGPEKTEFGSLLELTWGGKEPLTLKTGETRRFLEDGDTITLRGTARGPGYRIGFGDCAGTISPAQLDE